MRQRITFRPIPLNDEPRLAGWILAVGVFLVSVGSERGEAVAQAFGCFESFAFGSFQFTFHATVPLAGHDPLKHPVAPHFLSDSLSHIAFARPE